jgi:hypothetical protein
MKRKILAISIIVILLVITFSGCTENNNHKNNNNKGMITTSIIEYIITLDDLPNGFKEFYNGTDEQVTSEFSRYPEVKPLEFFARGFSKGNSSNETGYEIITCELNRFETIEDAENAFSPTIEYLITAGEFDVIDGSVNVIGNESKGITRENYQYSFLAFRIYNVIGLVSSYSFARTLELSQIVEERILNSIN